MAARNGKPVSTFYVDCQILNLRRSKGIDVSKLLVDSGSEFTWIPQPLLKKIGVRVEKKDVPFLMANGQTVSRATGYAILRAQVSRLWTRWCLHKRRI
jgi:aspartyl protease